MDSCWKYVQKPDIDVQLVNPQWILTRYAMNSNDAYITQARIGHLERIFQVPTIATASAVSLKKNEDSTNNPPAKQNRLNLPWWAHHKWIPFKNKICSIAVSTTPLAKTSRPSGTPNVWPVSAFAARQKSPPQRPASQPGGERWSL